MLLRYYKYNLKDARKKIKLNRVFYFSLASALNFLFYKTKDPAFLLLSYYYIAEEFNSFLDLEIYSKEYYEVKKLYDEIIRKYNDSINKTFNFTNPIEVSQAYNFAYKNGFLSKGKEFSYITDKNQLIENHTISGATIFTGNGCCGHSASLLSDIFSDYGFESAVISTGINSSKKIIGIPESQLSKFKSIMPLTSSFLEENGISAEEFIDFISEGFYKNASVIEKWEYDKDNVPLNHAITGVGYEGQAYYIDPTNEFYYRKDEETGRLINRSDNCENTIKTRFFEPHKNKRKIKKIISLPSADFDFIDTINDKTQKLCNDNLDTFIDFYLDNQYVYDEITEKLKKISM